MLPIEFELSSSMMLIEYDVIVHMLVLKYRTFALIPVHRETSCVGRSALELDRYSWSRHGGTITLTTEV